MLSHKTDHIVTNHKTYCNTWYNRNKGNNINNTICNSYSSISNNTGNSIGIAAKAQVSGISDNIAQATTAIASTTATTE